MDKDTAAKENGVKIYKWFLHIVSIGLLVQLCRSLFILHDGWFFIYLFFILYFGLKLATINKIEKEAEAAGMSTTQYMEFLKKKNKR